MPYNSDKWTASSGEDRYRRSLYTFWRRTSPYPSFMTFDATSREFCTVRRVRTNTPLAGADAAERPGVVRSGAGAGPADGVGRQHGGRTRRVGREAGAVASGGARRDRSAGGRVREGERELPGSAATPTRTWRRGRWSPTCCSISTKRSPRNRPIGTPSIITAAPLLRAGLVRDRRSRAGVADGRRRAGRGSEGSGLQPRFRAEGEARHLPVHGRRAVADRSVRSEAGPDQARRPGHSRGAHQGRALRVHQGHAEAARLAVPVPEARPVGRRDLRAAAQPGEDRRRGHRSSARCRRRSSTMRRRRSS